MNTNTLNIDKTKDSVFPTSYREVRHGKTLYRITSVYKGEKELGATLEKLVIQRVLADMDGKSKELLRT